jgi:hypothetical protein
MADSTLSVTYNELAASVGRFMGYGATSGDFTADQLADVVRAINSGYRQFLSPMVSGRSHTWSFLSPVTSLTLTVGDWDYDAPDAFGGVKGPMTYSTEISSHTIRQTGEGEIRRLRQVSLNQAMPALFAVRPKTPDATEGQRYEFLFYPTPDKAYVLNYSYYLHVNKLTAAAPYPLGGALHGETLMQACLAAAELQAQGQQGAQWQAYQERLAASIEMDIRSMTPETLGYCGNGHPGWISVQPPQSLYNGVSYGE